MTTSNESGIDGIKYLLQAYGVWCVDPRGGMSFSEAQERLLAREASLRQAVIDEMLEIVNQQYEMSISDLELREYQEGAEIPVLSKTQLVASLQEMKGKQ